MKSLKSIFALLLITSSSLLASSKDKLVKSEYINGKVVPVVTLKTIEVSATKKEVQLNGSMISDETFASPKANMVKLLRIKNKLVPVVTLKTIEVTASRKYVASNNSADNNGTLITGNSNRVKTILFNGKLMPGVELNTAVVVATRTEKNVLKRLNSKVHSFFSVMFNHISF